MSVAPQGVYVRAMSLGAEWLDSRVDLGEVVVIDGATGSELEARGVPMVDKGWAVMAQLEYPDILRQVHVDYINAGAAAIITNTFAAGRHLLEPGGLGDRVADAHRLAVEIARQAREEAGQPTVVAGSISGYMADALDRRWWDRLDDTYNEQVSLLGDAGVDVIALEMMEHPELCGPAVNAAVESGLPVWLGFSARQTADGLMSSYKPDPIRFEDNVKALITDKVDAVFVMHTSVPDVTPSLKVVADYWDGPVGVYPESGYFIEPHWQFVDIIKPDDLVASANEWVESGVQIVGGCCGLGTRHIEALSSELS